VLEEIAVLNGARGNFGPTIEDYRTIRIKNESEMSENGAAAPYAVVLIDSTDVQVSAVLFSRTAYSRTQQFERSLVGDGANGGSVAATRLHAAVFSYLRHVGALPLNPTPPTFHLSITIVASLRSWSNRAVALHYIEQSTDPQSFAIQSFMDGFKNAFLQNSVLDLPGPGSIEKKISRNHQPHLQFATY
jgi:hypothetical protein